MTQQIDRGNQVFNQLQQLARAEARRTGQPTATQEYLTRHTLESFLHRLTATGHASGFVLKGGLLMGAYDVRRPTKDIDSNAVSVTVSDDWLRQIAADVAAFPSDDGVWFNAEGISVETIREDDSYTGLRLRMPATIGNARTELTWDVSTGDPIVPPPRKLKLQRVIGDPIEMWSYAPETTVAEKAVTILERGIASTRWRDYLDIVQLHRHGQLDQVALRQAVLAVASHRGVTLARIDDVVAGYGGFAQVKWAAWRRKNQLEHLCEEQLDDQMRLIAEIVNPVFVPQY